MDCVITMTNDEAYDHYHSVNIAENNYPWLE